MLELVQILEPPASRTASCLGVPRKARLLVRSKALDAAAIVTLYMLVGTTVGAASRRAALPMIDIEFRPLVGVLMKGIGQPVFGPAVGYLETPMVAMSGPVVALKLSLAIRTIAEEPRLMVDGDRSRLLLVVVGVVIVSSNLVVSVFVVRLSMVRCGMR